MRCHKTGRDYSACGAGAERQLRRVEAGAAGDEGGRDSLRGFPGILSSTMPRIVNEPSIIEAVGTKPKRIEEYVGRVNTADHAVSVAKMTSPSGWEEPGQRPEFREITVVLSGELSVEHEGGTLTVSAGQAVITEPGEWIRYSTPGPTGAEYIAVCLPAFSPETVHRDDAQAQAP